MSTKTHTLQIASELSNDAITVLVDSREKLPFNLRPMRTVRTTLDTGDYSIKGLESVVAVERKSLDDFVNCVGRDRARFEREIQRLAAYRCKAIIIEGSLLHIEQQRYRSSVHPNSVIGSWLSWTAQGVPFVFGGDRAGAERYCAWFLRVCARREWRLAHTFLAGLAGGTGVGPNEGGAGASIEMDKIGPNTDPP